MKTMKKNQAMFALGALLFAAPSFGQTLQEAIRLTESERYESATSMYKQLVAKEPTNGDNYFYFADNYMKADNVDSAQVLFIKGVSVNPAGPLALVGMGRILMYKGNAAEGQKKLNDAEIAVSNDKDKRNTGAYKAAVLLEIAETYTFCPNPDFDKAIEYTQKAQKFDPNNPSVFLVRGDAQSKKDILNASTAIESYKQAIVKDPKSCKGNLRIGQVYAAGQNMQEAIKYFDEAIKTDSTFAPAFRERGEAKYKIGQFKSASDDYRKYLALNNDPSARYRYAAFLYLSKDYKAAIEEIKTTQSTDSSIVVLYRILGFSYFETGDYANAKTAIDKFFVKAKAKGTPKVLSQDYEYRGKTLAKLNQDSLAIFDLKQALQEDSTRKELNFEIGAAYFKTKKYDSAAVYFKRKIDSKIKVNINDYNYYGRTLYLQKNYVLADSAFATVCKMDSTYLAGWLWRGNTNTKLDPETDKGLAKPYYEKFVQLAVADKEKNKKDLMKACDYLGYYHFKNNNFACAKAYYLLLKEIDPENAKAKNALENDPKVKAATAADLNTCYNVVK